MSKRYLGLPVPAGLAPPRDGVVHDVVRDQEECLKLRRNQSTLYKFRITICTRPAYCDMPHQNFQSKCMCCGMQDSCRPSPA